MTDVVTTTSTTTDTHDEGTLEHLDPQHLVLELNIRSDAGLTDDFLASITEHGVLVPIVAVRAPDGTTLVRAGQRRTLAARKAGLASVPVYVRPLADGDDTAVLVDRVAEQIVENDQRRALTEAQRLNGIQQLLDAGVTPTKVAQKLAVKKNLIKDAQVVSTSGAARAAVEAGQLSLTEAAALAEFEDLPGAAEKLTSVAGTARFEHAVAQLREHKLNWEAQQNAEAHWQEKGFTVLDTRPQPWDIDCVELSYLRDGDGNRATADVVTAPDQWAVLLDEREAWLDTTTGEQVEEAAIDWNTEDDPDATPADGLRNIHTVKEGYVYAADFFCLDYVGAGLTLDSWFLRNAGVVPVSDENTDADEDDDAAQARAAALAKAQAEVAERQRRERRKVIALNRLGDAAITVRRDFVATLLTRKTLPKGAAIFIAGCVLREPGLISDYRGALVTADLLGVSEGDHLHHLVTDLPPTGDGRAHVLVLAAVLGALEARTPKEAWRGGGAGAWRYHISTGEYLGFLVTHGYELAEVEKVATGEITADEVYDAILAHTVPQGAGSDTGDD